MIFLIFSCRPTQNIFPATIFGSIFKLCAVDFDWSVRGECAQYRTATNDHSSYCLCVESNRFVVYGS